MTNAAKGSLRVTSVAPTDLTTTDHEDWEELFELQSYPSNPFLSPTWVMGWYRNFVQPDDPRIVLVRNVTTGQLVGVAPMHRQAVRVGPMTFAHRLVMVGMGIGPNPFELPGYLARPDYARDVARAVVSETLDATTGWCELAIDPNQGWFEPEWTYGKNRPATFSSYQRPRACVILPLAATWEEQRSSLKRNVKESLRRSQNRLTKNGRPFSLHRRTGEEVTTAIVRRFLELHRLRSRNEQAGVHHVDAFADPRNRNLILSVVPELAAQGRAYVIELEIDGDMLASQLVLHSPGSSYVHSSGFHPDIWSLGPVTYLHGELIKAAIERGDSVVNFSPGPNVSKLRWSEQLWVTNEFAYGSGARSVGFRFAAHQAMSAVRASTSAISFVRKSSTPRTTTPTVDSRAVRQSSAGGPRAAHVTDARNAADTGTPYARPRDFQMSQESNLLRVSGQV
ncbi:GNAT family N-acetyltransferase [Nakamurella sp. GG22]